MIPVLRTARAAVFHGDCLDVLASFPDHSIDAVVCDPPYGLSELSEKKVSAALSAWFGGDRYHVPDGRGMMNLEWDRFVPPPAVWDECRRVLKPGGALAAFAGSRTVDLMGLSIRMAGFEMNGLGAWLRCGFPKSLDVGKALDAAQGASRPVVGISAAPNGKDGGYAGARYTEPRTTVFGTVCDQPPRTAPVTEAAKRWQGYGTNLKPGHEPIVLAHAPGAPPRPIDNDRPRYFYTGKAPRTQRPSYVGADGKRVEHSTVKPLAVMEWLVELLCPEDGIVLDPFAGSGTTLEAAVRMGRYAVGIERHEPYLPLIAQRLERAAAGVP